MQKRKKRYTRYSSYDDNPYYYSRRGYYGRRGFWESIKQFFVRLFIVVVIALVIGLAIFLFILYLLHPTQFVATTIRVLLIAGIIAGVILACCILYWGVSFLTALSKKMAEGRVARARSHQEKLRMQQTKIAVQRERDQLQRERAASGLLRTNSSYQPLSPTRRQPLTTRQLAEMEPPTPEEVEEESELEQMGMPKKGQVFAYRDYKKYLKPGQLIIGVRKDGTVRTGSWQDFKIMLILGASSSGKSTTVLEKCACIVDLGGWVVICDPGGFKPDSLIQRLGPLGEALMPATTLALEHEDIMRNMKRFRDELERRRRGASMEIPILLVIDELNGLLMDKTIKKELTELIEKFAQQARGYNMYMILCAQKASGLAAIRNSVISFICHKCPEMEAEKILPARYAKYTSQLGVGQTFVGDADGFIEPLQQTLITKQDLAERAGARPNALRVPRQRKQQPEQNQSLSPSPLPRKRTVPMAAPAQTQSSRERRLILPAARQQSTSYVTEELIQEETLPVQRHSPTTTNNLAIWGETTVPLANRSHVQPGKSTEELAPRASPDVIQQFQGDVKREKLAQLAALRKKKQKQEHE